MRGISRNLSASQTQLKVILEYPLLIVIELSKLFLEYNTTEEYYEVP